MYIRYPVLFQNSKQEKKIENPTLTASFETTLNTHPY